MKTIREILLERHRTLEPSLDAIRQRAVGMLAKKVARAVPSASSVSSFARTAMFALQSLRWHLAGLGAAWLAIALLNIDHTPASSPGIARQHVPSPRQLLTALRENRRQLMEMIGTSVSAPPSAPPRRSEYQPTTEMA